MNGVRRLSIRRLDPHFRSFFRFFQAVFDLVAQMRHRRHARRRGAVREHRRLEVARRKHSGDVCHMLADLVPAFGVLGIVHLDFDDSTVFEEAKVVRRFGVREAHGLVSALDYLVLMSAVVLWSVLLLRPARQAQR